MRYSKASVLVVMDLINGAPGSLFFKERYFSYFSHSYRLHGPNFQIALTKYLGHMVGVSFPQEALDLIKNCIEVSHSSVFT